MDRRRLDTQGLAREEDFEPLMVFVDEYAAFRANLMDWYVGVKQKGDPAKPPCLSKVASIARKGRTSRVHLLFATQRPDAEYFGQDMCAAAKLDNSYRCTGVAMAAVTSKMRRSPTLAASREALLRVGAHQTTLTIEAGLDVQGVREVVREHPNVAQKPPLAPYVSDSPGSHAQATGRALWNTVFSGRLGLALGQAARAADADRQALTGRFVRESPQPDSSDDEWWQPWELIHEPSQGGFLALATGRSIVRGPIWTGPSKPLPTGRPLQVAVAVVYPQTILSGLHFLEGELEWLCTKLPSSGLCSVDKAPPLLTQVAFLDFVASCDADVLHVVCTGWQGRLISPEAPIDLSTLAVPGTQMASWLVDEAALISRIRDSNIGLVVLNGCSVERTAEALADSGVTVLCHRGDVSDEYAAALPEAFYPRIVAGQPTDLAISDARRTLEQRFPGQAAWTTTTLFTSWPPTRFHPPPTRETTGESTAYPEPVDTAPLDGLLADDLIALMRELNRERLHRTGDTAWDQEWQPVQAQLALCGAPEPAAGACPAGTP